MSPSRPPDPEALASALRGAAGAWNLYGLPLALAALTAALFARDRAGAWAARRRSVRVVGLIHGAMALWSLMAAASALWASRGMGVVAEQVALGVVAPVLFLPLDLAAGLGLWRLRGWARRLAVALWLTRAAFSALALSFAWRYGAVFDPAEWPTAVAGRALPAALLVVLLLPGTARAVRGGAGETPDGPADFAAGLAVRWLLLVLVSVVVTDATDLAVHAAAGV